MPDNRAIRLSYALQLFRISKRVTLLEFTLPENTMNRSKLNNCYLYVLDTLADWEIAYLTAELHSGRYLDGGRVAICKLSADQDSVTSMGGMRIFADRKLSQTEFVQSDLLILPGADTWMESRHKPLLGMVEDLIGRGVTVAAICGATVALAEQGVLDKRRHTSNDKGFLENFCPNYKGSANYLDQPAVSDGNLITASGLAALDFCYQVLEKTQVMTQKTLEAWYGLYTTREARYFHQLSESVE